MASGILDANGNNYGGTSAFTSGVGDTVIDARGIQATVISIRPGWPGKPAEVDVLIASPSLAGAPGLPPNLSPWGLPGNPPNPFPGVPTSNIPGGQSANPAVGIIPNVSLGVLPLIVTVYAAQLIIVSHADGTGLVSGGASTPLVGDTPPGDKNSIACNVS